MLPGPPCECSRNILKKNAVSVAFFVVACCYVGQQHPAERDMERTLHKLEGLNLPLFPMY